MFHCFERWRSGLRCLARYVLTCRRLLSAHSEQPRRRDANEFSSPDMMQHSHRRSCNGGHDITPVVPNEHRATKRAPVHLGSCILYDSFTQAPIATEFQSDGQWLAADRPSSSAG